MRQSVQELIERYQHNIYGVAFNVCKNAECFLQVLFGQSCKIFLDIVACPNWTKLQSGGQSCLD